MSTVLWANMLVNGAVESEEADYDALYKHQKKLDSICKTLKLTPFEAFCDTTDAQFNMGEAELPPGVESTTDLMKAQGVWIDAAEAVEILGKVLAHVRSSKTRFGFLRDDHSAVVEELEASLAFAQKAAQAGARFNYCVVA